MQTIYNFGTNELKIIAIILSDRIWNMVNIIRMALLYRKLKEIILGLELIQRKENVSVGIFL